MLETKVVVENEPMERVEKDTEVVINREYNPEIRILSNHRLVGKYCIRVSKARNPLEKKHRGRLESLCKVLNKMVADREGIFDRFKLVTCKHSSSHQVILRRAIPGDLMSAVE